MTTTSKRTPTGDTTPVAVTVITLSFILHPVGVVGTFSHEVIAVTLLFIMPYGLTEHAVRVLGDLDIPLEKLAVFKSMLASGSTDLTI